MAGLLKNRPTKPKISQKQAERLFDTPDEHLLALLDAANRLRRERFGRGVDLCSCINAKSGNCPEDCRFCAQSVRHESNTKIHPLLSENEILANARKMAAAGAHRFCIVVSGRRLKGSAERTRVLKNIEKIRKTTSLHTCASLGFLEPDWARRLAAAGLERYHHNLESAPSFYPQVCTTHPIERRIETLHTASDAGLEVCSGGIWGLGETPAQRIEMALTLRGLPVMSVPINLLNPIPGTPLENQPPESPLDHLKMVAVYRLILPEAEIRFAGGREANLRQLMPLGLLAGANGLMIGNYLTTRGRDIGKDMEMLADLGLIPECAGEKTEKMNGKRLTIGTSK